MRLNNHSLSLSDSHLAVAESMIDASGNNLAFLLSTPRAGSTLLSAILGRHSKIHCPSEPWFLLPLLTMCDEQPGQVSRYDRRMASLAIKELLPPEQFLEAARAFALQIYNGQLTRAGKSIFIDKTPRYYHILPSLNQTFPKSKKIWLQRNPLDVAASFVSTWNIPVVELCGECLTPSSFDLSMAIHSFAHFFQGLSGTYELRYEDLVQDAPKHIRHLCHFLEVEPEAGLENYAEKNGSLELLKDKTMGDKKVFGHSKPHHQSVGQWKKVLDRHDVQQVIDSIGQEAFERMGYFEIVRDLKNDGFVFPSRAAVAERLETLRQRAQLFPMTTEQIHSFEEMHKYVKRISRHRWIRLGRRLRLFRSQPGKTQ